MNDLWWWLGIGGVVIFALLSWWAPDWLIWKRARARQDKIDRKWGKMVHDASICSECARLWCSSCFPPEDQHFLSCSYYKITP